MLFLALFLGSLELCAGIAYSISIGYECTKVTPSGCILWTQIGKIEEGGSCFPGDSLVLTPEGPTRLDVLQVGDLILGHDAATGVDSFTPVRAWLHRAPVVPQEYLKLTTEEGTMEVTRFHNVAVVTEEGLDFPYAEQITEGSFLKTREGKTRVQSQSALVKVGVFAPLTRLSNFYVGTNSSNLLLAHSFAHVRFPQTFEPIVQGLVSLAEFWNPKINEVTDEEMYVHPVAQTLQDIFSPFVMDFPQGHLMKHLTSVESFKSL